MDGFFGFILGAIVAFVVLILNLPDDKLYHIKCNGDTQITIKGTIHNYVAKNGCVLD